MATTNDALFLQVDASVELLRRQMADGAGIVDTFSSRVGTAVGNVDKKLEKMGGGFKAFEKLVERAGTVAQRSMTDAMTTAERAAAKLVETAGGAGPNAGAADARAFANQAAAKARAARVVAEAVSREAKSFNEWTGEQVKAVRGAQLLAAQMDRVAQEAAREAGALERLEIELMQTAEGQQLLAARQRAGTAVSGQARAGMQQLSFQMNDVAVQYAAGTSASIIFAQQSGQVIQALQMMGLEGNALLKFLGSWQGMLLTTVLVAATPFVAKLLEGNDALADGVKKLKEEAAQTEVTRQAKIAFSHTIEGQIDAQRRLNDELEREFRTQRQIQQLAVANAQRTLAGSVEKRADLQRQIAAQTSQVADYQRRLDRPNSADAENLPAIAILAGKAQEKLADLQRQQITLTGEIVRGEQSIRAAQLPLIQSDVEARFDKNAAAVLRYTKALGNLNNQLKIGEGKTGWVNEFQADGSMRRKQMSGISVAEYERQYGDILQKKIAAEKAASDAKRTVSTGSQVDTARGADLFATAAKYRGLSETRDDAALERLFKQAGLDLDPKIKAWCAAFVNGVLAEQGIGGNGSLSARSFLTFGDKTNTPVKGDIVVSRRGNDPSAGHVGFFQGTDAKGNILVLGGNTGNKVGTQTVAKSDVLGFRRPSGTAGDRASAAAEAIRQRGISEDISFTDMERAARKRLIDAKQKSAATEEEADALAREEINAQADAEKVRIGLLEKAHKLEEPEADRLRGINEEARQQQLRNVDLAKAARLIERGYYAKQHGLEAELAQLRLDLDLATTLADRKRISAEILAIEQQLRRQALEKVRDNPYSTAKDIQQARDDLAALPKTETKERAQNAQQNMSPMEEYRDRLTRSTSDMKTALEDVKVNALQGLEDGLVGIVTGTESVAGAFKKMAASIIADLARIAIEKAIVQAIGTSFFGLNTGGAVADVPGRRSGGLAGFAGGGSPGGLISGPGTGTSDSILALLANGGGAIRISDQEFIVNAAATKRFLPLLRMINAGGLPGFASGGLPSMATPAMPRLSLPAVPQLAGRAGSSGGDLTVRVILTDDLDARIDNRAAGVAVQVVKTAAPTIVDSAHARTMNSFNRATL